MGFLLVFPGSVLANAPGNISLAPGWQRRGALLSLAEEVLK